MAEQWHLTLPRLVTTVEETEVVEAEEDEEDSDEEVVVDSAEVRLLLLHSVEMVY